MSLVSRGASADSRALGPPKSNIAANPKFASRKSSMPLKTCAMKSHASHIRCRKPESQNRGVDKTS